MSCAPRVSADDEEAQPIIIGRTEHDEDVEIAWNPDARQWRTSPTGTTVNGRLIAWRPVTTFSAPSEETMALSLADDCEAQAENHDRMAPFLPPEKEKAAHLRSQRDKYLAVAKKSR